MTTGRFIIIELLTAAALVGAGLTGGTFAGGAKGAAPDLSPPGATAPAEQPLALSPHIVEKPDMVGRVESLLPWKVERPDGEPTQEDMIIVTKMFFSKLRTYPDIRFRDYFDPRYLKEHGLVDKDIAFETIPGGGIYTLGVADDNRTALCVIENQGDKEVFVLRWVVHEGHLYVQPAKPPDLDTGIFTPWMLRLEVHPSGS